MKKYIIPLIKNELLAPGAYLHTYDCREIAEAARAGQFVSILPGAAYDPLLRRPFSVCTRDKKAGTFTVLIKVIGPGTRMLADLAPGTKVDMLAPLGLHFHWEGATRLILVAGGVGVAPLLTVCQEVKEAYPDGKSGGRPEIVFCYGAQSADQFVLLDRIEPLVDRLALTTDDGSRGAKGFVTEAAEGQFSDDATILTCGPNVMMNDLLRRMRAHGLEGQCSLENQMGCTIGACLGCVVTTRDGYRRICIEGPVLPTELFDKIEW